jgi:anti-anti-sigma factor
MDADFQFQLHEVKGSLYLCLEGNLDERHFLTVSGLLSDKKIDHPVKVDLQKVRYADSSGLRALALLQRRVEDAGMNFTLVEPSTAIKRVYGSIGLSQAFAVRPDDPDSPCDPSSSDTARS